MIEDSGSGNQVTARSEILIEARNLSKIFSFRTGYLGSRRDLHALSNVSLRIRRGGITGCAGESGCGKTTLAKILLLLEKPTEGKVLFEGEEVTASGDRKRTKSYRRRAQLVFQSPYSSLPARMTIQSILVDPLAIHGIGDHKSRIEKAVRVLSMVGLSERALRRYPREFSGGQRQRICIARALMLDPQLLICDEPVSSLDASIKSQILNLLKSLRDELHLTILIISHDLRVIKYLTNDLIIMYLGTVVEVGDTERAFARPLHPYTQSLLRAIPDRTMPHERLSVLQGDVPSPIDLPKGCLFANRCSMKRPRCDVERPSLRNIVGTQWSACHFSEELAMGSGSA